MSTPIKRHESLQPLSRDHHHGLLLCWKIREGFKRHIEAERIKHYSDWFWKTHLVPHFETEEKHVFPILGNNHPHVMQAIAEHRRLKSLFEQKSDISEILSLIEHELEQHIRFEERVLFNEIQQKATAEQLAQCEKHHHSPETKEAWQDEFWKD
jgi:iron-sulfur cluster repair protein YtfE (RIC family)